MLSLLDFASLVLLFPVFGVLASGQGSTATTANLPVIGSADPQLLVGAALVLLIVRALCGFLFRFWWGQRAALAEVGLSSRLLQAYAYAPYAFHLRRNSADLLARAVSHVNMATTAGLNGLVTLATDV